MGGKHASTGEDDSMGNIERKLRQGALVLLLSAAAGCQEPEDSLDDGSVFPRSPTADASAQTEPEASAPDDARDGAPPDTGTSTGGRDAQVGAPNDAGAEDSGTDEPDADAPDASVEPDAGTPDSGVDEGDCPSALEGWATVSGDGIARTTGGGTAAPVRPKNAAELMAYASDDTPRVIEIAGTFDVPRLQINSNKTLLGVGQNATIRGGLSIRGNKNAPVRNVILKNLRIDGATTGVDGDAVQIYFAHHVWIDHCEIWDGPDGNLDMTHAVNWVTVSWTKFRYTSNYKRPSGESSDHRFSSLIGHSDGNASEDSGRLKITFHHNWWADGVIERMPRVRYGQVHVFNNYYASPGNNYCVRAGRNAQLLIEGNYFDRVNSPHQFNNSSDQATAHITARDNVYAQTSGDQATGGGGTPFTKAPYAFTQNPASEVPALVKRCAGPR